MALSERQRIFAAELVAFLRWASENNYGYRFGDFYRSTDKLSCPNCKQPTTYQELLFSNGKSKLKYGMHNDRLAADIIFSLAGKDLEAKDYLPLGEEWERRGGRWGGRFGENPAGAGNGWDSNHFESQ